MRRTAASWALALFVEACAPAEEPPTEIAQPPAASEPARPTAVEPAAPEQPPGPALPVVGEPPPSDELLLLANATCDAHTSDTEGCAPTWRGLARTPTHPQFVACELDPVGLDEPRSRQLIRGRIDILPFEDGSHRHRCVIVEVKTRLAANEHGIQPLDAHSIGIVDIGVAPAAQHLDVGELERGPTRVFLGLDSGRVLVASVYLHDLGPLLAIPGRPLITTEMLRADFDAALQQRDRLGWVGGAKSFAPQVGDADERRAYAFTPVLSAAAADGDAHETHPWDHASAVPLRAADGRRYLVMSFGTMKSSWESAKRRGQMIVRIVEDDLHPDESTAK
jgi:hypothetical protein